ncbi:H(+)-transporting V1 sector ATPase subunit E [Ascoidea rubescens DSM 1968]|uniref:Subunit E of the eight-subunit V1 peripheral membrane domain of the vacuolar H+-ATPase n=1 Tax=Ascoidea rubescens DSM 1968 TaxID=1344418 RepID=A0A1D2VGS8_9ASCO|nr:subunit E of the eight-subunit V1 peripheral membrane domain of the vacuolar H+-ATPase [Ascoidea rubescens DSM 1968]ODV60750.1 subunit E of the eight-subunit V1 peripheral membrane domain of the vacuolar H+-ATPase [Ascoidea rubescens DSM 1968]
MAAVHGLSDDQVVKELHKMEAFIKKEAEEKAKEIKLKADEEYEIEKANIVRSEISSIDSLYESKLKKASLQQQITKSTISNKTRLQILSEREKILDDIFELTANKLKIITTKNNDNDSENYKKILIGLIQEGLLSLLESKIYLRLRKNDVSLVKDSIEDLEKYYKEKTSHETTIEILEDQFLDDNVNGGVIIINSTKKIDIDNTLDERLKLLSELSLPAIRLKLFGPSKTRKFFD